MCIRDRVEAEPDLSDGTGGDGDAGEFDPAFFDQEDQ